MPAATVKNQCKGAPPTCQLAPLFTRKVAASAHDEAIAAASAGHVPPGTCFAKRSRCLIPARLFRRRHGVAAVAATRPVAGAARRAGVADRRGQVAQHLDGSMSRSGLGLLSSPLADLRMDASPYLILPNDHYAHAEAPFERWRHVGTLRCGARRFGVEVSAARVHGAGRPALLMASIGVTDVAAARQYQKTTWRNWTPGWAESDPGQPWTVAIGAAGEDGALALRASRHDPLDMSIEAGFVDAATGKPLRLKLRLSQQRAPMLAWGGGRRDWPSGPDGAVALEHAQ